MYGLSLNVSSLGKLWYNINNNKMAHMKVLNGIIDVCKGMKNMSRPYI